MDYFKNKKYPHFACRFDCVNTPSIHLLKVLGLTLVEMMVSLFLAMYLFSLLITVYLAACHTQQTQTALEEIEANAFAVTQILISDIHKSGQLGCTPVSRHFHVRAFAGFDLTTTNRLTASGAQSFTVRHAGYPAAVLLVSMSDGRRMQADRGVRFASGDIAVIANCRRAEIFRVDNVIQGKNEQLIVSTLPLHDKYDPYSEISRLEINRYFVKPTGRIDENGKPASALFREDIQHRQFEMVTGVSAMNLQYTVRRGGQLVDLPAEEVSDWSAVTGIDITLELVSSTIRKCWYAYAAMSV